MKQAILNNLSPISDDIFFTKTEQSLLSLSKSDRKPILQKIKIKLKTHRLSTSLALQRASSLLLHTAAIKELQTAREYRVEYFDKTTCTCKTNEKMTRFTFIFE